MFKNPLSHPTAQDMPEKLTGSDNNKRSGVNHTGGANDAVDDITDNPVVEISRDIFRLESDIRKLTVRVDKRLITKNIQDSLQNFRRNFDLYFESFKTPGHIDAILTAGANTATYGESVGHILNRFSSLGFENRRLAQQIIQKARTVNNALATRKEDFIRGLSDYNASDLPNLEKNAYAPPEEVSSSLLKRSVDFSKQSPVRKPEPSTTEHKSDPIGRRSDQLQRAQASSNLQTGQRSVTDRPPTGTDTTARSSSREQELTELLKKSRRQIKQFMAHAKKVETAYGRKYKKIQQLHDESLEEIQKSRKEIEQLQSQLSGSTIAASLEQCADAERSNADFYRYVTVAYLGVFFLLMSYLFFETTTVGFDAIKTGVRAFLTLCILVPCGYIAGESRMHRNQEHSYMRMALELKAKIIQSQKILESKPT